MAANNNDRLSALRGMGSTVRLPRGRTTNPWGQRHYPAAAAAATGAGAAAATTIAVPKATPAPKRQISTYNCCCCSQDFTRDTTDDPDPRPSPLGDRCDACRDAGVERPFEQSGLTLTDLLKPWCRFCKGDHWAMNCPESK